MKRRMIQPRGRLYPAKTTFANVIANNDIINPKLL